MCLQLIVRFELTDYFVVEDEVIQVVVFIAVIIVLILEVEKKLVMKLVQ